MELLVERRWLFKDNDCVLLWGCLLLVCRSLFSFLFYSCMFSHFGFFQMKIGTDFDGHDVEMFASGDIHTDCEISHSPICISWKNVKYTVDNVSFNIKSCKRVVESVSLLRSVRIWFFF